MRLEYFQMVDQITEIDLNAGTIRVDSTVPDASPVFEGHFPGHPLLPGVLMIETMAQTCGWLILSSLNFTHMPFLAQSKEAKMRSFVVPGQKLTIFGTLVHNGSGYSVATARIESEGKRVADAELTFRVVPFPNEQLRGEMLASARRIGVPEEYINA